MQYSVPDSKKDRGSSRVGSQRTTDARELLAMHAAREAAQVEEGRRRRRRGLTMIGDGVCPFVEH